jgi:hypothetical protein
MNQERVTYTGDNLLTDRLPGEREKVVLIELTPHFESAVVLVPLLLEGQLHLLCREPSFFFFLCLLALIIIALIRISDVALVFLPSGRCGWLSPLTRRFEFRVRLPPDLRGLVGKPRLYLIMT